MAKSDPRPTKRCFLATPIGEPGSDDRKLTDGLVKITLRPIVEDKLGYQLVVPHLDMDQPGSITRQILKHLLRDELVIANLSGYPHPNPNVMYELAVRHAAQLPVVTIAREGTAAPFDIGDQRRIPFSDDPEGIFDLKEPLTKAVAAAEAAPNTDNPLVAMLRTTKLLDNVEASTFEASVLGSLESIKRRLPESRHETLFENTPMPSAFVYGLSGETVESALAFLGYEGRASIDSPNSDGSIGVGFEPSAKPEEQLRLAWAFRAGGASKVSWIPF